MCEKCRLIELFDEELARFESYDNGEAFSIARHRYALERHGISEGRAMVIAHGEPFQEQTDPLAEWKALEPGRKVLEIETKDILRVGNKDKDGLFLQRSNYHELDMFTWEKLSNGYQILHEGQFDAGKLQPGDWFWISEPFKEWVRFNHSKPNGLISIIDGNIVYTCYPYKTSFHFSPPTPPSREERIEKAAKKILGLRKDCLYCEDHGLCEAEISIVLTELMEGKP